MCSSPRKSANVKTAQKRLRQLIWPTKSQQKPCSGSLFTDSIYCTLFPHVLNCLLKVQDSYSPSEKIDTRRRGADGFTEGTPSIDSNFWIASASEPLIILIVEATASVPLTWTLKTNDGKPKNTDLGSKSNTCLIIAKVTKQKTSFPMFELFAKLLSVSHVCLSTFVDSHRVANSEMMKSLTRDRVHHGFPTVFPVHLFSKSSLPIQGQSMKKQCQCGSFYDMFVTVPVTDY